MISKHVFEFGPGKPLTGFKYTTKISRPQLPLWDATIICA